MNTLTSSTFAPPERALEPERCGFSGGMADELHRLGAGAGAFHAKHTGLIRKFAETDDSVNGFAMADRSTVDQKLGLVAIGKRIDRNRNPRFHTVCPRRKCVEQRFRPPLCSVIVKRILCKSTTVHHTKT